MLLENWKKEVSFDPRKEKIINRALTYFNNSSFSSEHENAFSSNKTTYFSLKNSSLEDILDAKNEFSFFIIDHINNSFEAKNRWQQLKAKAAFDVSIDFYNIGFLFIKNGQAKEDFCIRI